MFFLLRDSCKSDVLSGVVTVQWGHTRATLAWSSELSYLRFGACACHNVGGKGKASDGVGGRTLDRLAEVGMLGQRTSKGTSHCAGVRFEDHIGVERVALPRLDDHREFYEKPLTWTSATGIPRVSRSLSRKINGCSSECPWRLKIGIGVDQIAVAITIEEVREMGQVAMGTNHGAKHHGLRAWLLGAIAEMR